MLLFTLCNNRKPGELEKRATKGWEQGSKWPNLPSLRHGLTLASSSLRQWDEKGSASPPTVRAAGGVGGAEDVVSVELSEQACSWGFVSCPCRVQS